MAGDCRSQGTGAGRACERLQALCWGAGNGGSESVSQNVFQGRLVLFDIMGTTWGWRETQNFPGVINLRKARLTANIRLGRTTFNT